MVVQRGFVLGAWLFTSSSKLWCCQGYILGMVRETVPLLADCSKDRGSANWISQYWLRSSQQLYLM